jgi:hypothetical protein
MMDATLGHLHATALGRQCVLRGSALTALWVPERGVVDLDFLVDGDWTPESLAPLLQDALATQPGVQCELATIWAETDFPGVRATLRSTAGALQVDFSWGELLATPPIERVVRGLPWRTVAPEVMFGWKVHSLVEHGLRGRWHAKTLADLVLYLRRVPMDLALARRAVEASFASQRMPLSHLDGFFDDPTWGRSRGSRNKWKSYVKKSPWVTFALAEALAEARGGLGRLLGRP